MTGSLAGFAKFFVLSAVWLVIASLFVTYSSYLWTRVTSANVVHIESFIGVGSTEDTLGPYFVARARELSARVPLDGLYEVNIPPLANNFGTKDSFIKLPSEAKVSVGGFDLAAVANALANVFPDDRYIVAAHPDSPSSNSTIQLEWKSPSGTKRHWLLVIDKDDAIDLQDKAAVNRRLVDRAIYHLLYHMYYDSEGAKVWAKNEKPNVQFPDARSLEAYYAGQQHLNVYLSSYNPNELAHAEREFRILQERLPRFVDGLMLLGITLSENRRERGAITAYENAIRELGLPPENDHKSWNTLLQARLFKAVARRKLYNWRELHLAVSEFDQLDKDLRERISRQVDPHDIYDLQKILATVLAEKANTIGYYLVLINYENFDKALGDKALPPSLQPQVDLDVIKIRPPDNTAMKLDDDEARMRDIEKATKQRAAALRVELRLLRAAQLAAQQMADNYAKEIIGSDPSRQSVRDKLDNILRSADGYAQFRAAQVLVDDNSEYMAQCNQALAQHRLADAAQPNHYIVLQNMGMIYGDARYDASGRHIETSRRLFQRSIDIKHNDYFGKWNLAALVVRQGHHYGPELAKSDLISGGIEAAEKARDIAPGYWIAYKILAQLYALRWAKETEIAKKEMDENLVQASLVTAKTLGGNEVQLETARLQWEFLRLRTETDATKFEKARQKFIESLKVARDVAVRNPSWEVLELTDSIDQLKAALVKTTIENAKELRWPN